MFGRRSIPSSGVARPFHTRSRPRALPDRCLSTQPGEGILVRTLTPRVIVPLIQRRLSPFLQLCLFPRTPSHTTPFTEPTPRPTFHWMGLLALTMVLAGEVSLGPTPLLAQEPNFEKFLNTPTQKITAVTSNLHAQAFVRATMGPFIHATSHKKSRGRRHKKPPLPATITQKMVNLAAGVATWHFSSEMEMQLHQGHKRGMFFLHDTSNEHLTWLTKVSTQPKLHRVFALANTYLELAATQQPAIVELPHYARYAQYLYLHYSIWTKENKGWFTIAEKARAQGVIQRLHEYWDIEASKESDFPIPSVRNQESYAARYLHQHYLPLHQAYLQAALVTLQMETEHRTRVMWNQLRQWQTDQKRKRSLLRLCGTWQWLIHNHQNHGDYTTVMIYPSPSQYDRMDPKPAKIQVQGDTVYIRWEFPRGIIQEESLLFSEKDRALSGTFVNNMGPNGSITGRRVKPCKEK